MPTQRKIIDKAIAFLQKEKKNSINKNDISNITEIIDWLSKSTGICTGLANLRLYAHKISDINPNPDKPIDNITNLEKYMQMLLNWDEHKKYSQYDHSEMERLICYFLNPYYKTIAKFPGYYDIYSNNIPDIGLSNEEYITLYKQKLIEMQGSLLDSGDIEDNKGNKINEIRIGKIILTNNLLPNILDKIIKPGDMILVIIDQSHSIAIYHSPIANKIYFYDPNNEEEYDFTPSKHIDKLSDFIWKKRQETNSNQIPIKSFEFIIRKFPNDQVYYYPKKEELTISSKQFINLLNNIPESLHNLMLNKYFDESKTILDFVKNENLPERLKKILLDHLATNLKNSEIEIANELIDHWQNYLNEHREYLLRIKQNQIFYDSLVNKLSANNLYINNLCRKDIKDVLLQDISDIDLETMLLQINIKIIEDIKFPLLLTKILIQYATYNPVIEQKFYLTMYLSKKLTYNDQNNPLKIYFTHKEKKTIEENLLKFKHVLDFYNSNDDEFSIKKYNNEQLQDILENKFCSRRLAKKLFTEIDSLSDSLLNLLINKYQHLYTKDELHTIQIEALKDSLHSNCSLPADTELPNLTESIIQTSDVSLVDNTEIFND